MLSSAALFIDSSNFYHSLREAGHLPFDYNLLFELLSEKYELKEIRFYDAIKDRIRDPEGYAKQQKFHAHLKKLNWKVEMRTRKLKYISSISQAEVDAAADGAGIIDSCRKKLMDFLGKLGLIRLTKEKGIDIMLAVDAIDAARAKRAETVIILSGDADFVPAVQAIRAFGATVVNLHTYNGSSNDLRSSCNSHLLIDFDSYGQPDIIF